MTCYPLEGLALFSAGALLFFFFTTATAGTDLGPN
jgi:hypothetical protein